jgi:hypothetical protein
MTDVTVPTATKLGIAFVFVTAFIALILVVLVINGVIAFPNKVTMSSGLSISSGDLVIQKGGVLVGTIPTNATTGKSHTTPADGEIIMGGSLFVGTQDANGTGGIYVGDFVNAKKLYAAGGDGTANDRSTFGGQTRIYNGYMNGTVATYTATSSKPATTNA